MKKLLIVTCFLCAIVTSCQKNTTQKVNGIELDRQTLTMTCGTFEQLTATVLPENATDKTLSWLSSDAQIADVDQNGKVEAKSVGNATITVTCGEVSAECQVTVTPKQAESITLNQTEATMEIDDVLQLTATVSPADADTESMAWSSSNTTVAIVDGKGLVKAIADGNTIITVTCGEVSAECKITVNKAIPEVGNFYYSDGSYSKTLKADKTVIGVIFYLGDPTAQDAALKRDHKECSNGLVVAVNHEIIKTWQTNYKAFKLGAPEYEGIVGNWVAKNTTDYESIYYKTKPIDPNFNQIKGYNNTRAMEAFNAAPENAEWQIDLIQKLSDFSNATKAPESTSGWYIPSPKELSLICTGEYEGNIYEISNNDPQIANREIIDKALQEISGADLLGSNTYWTSAEDGASYAHRIIMGNGSFYYQLKNSTTASFDLAVRYILAF